MTVKSAPNCAVPDNPATIRALKLKVSLCDYNNDRLKTAASVGRLQRSLRNKVRKKKTYVIYLFFHHNLVM